MSSPNSPLSLDREGPALESLLRRIAEVPEDFLPPSGAARPRPAIPAVVHDVAASLGVELSAADLQAFRAVDPRDVGFDPQDGPRLSLTLLLSWIVADEWCRVLQPTGPDLLALLHGTAGELARQGSAAKYRNDPDRREELSRLVLAHFGCRPAGETKAQAQDRLTSLSTLERARVLQASRAAEQRARAIRAALAKKAAEESADKWTRE